MMDQEQTTESHRWVFWLIAACIPFLVLALLELTLRMAGFAQQTDLFIDNPAHEAYQLARPDVIERYFPEGFAPKVALEPTFFLKQKPENGFRVAVQGGSTAAGFPYGLGASIAGMLDSRLRQSLPGRYVEVINVSMSAVNSYFLLDTADEIIATQPDVVVIYAGHNEYLGIFGVGSTYTTFQQPRLMSAFLALRQLAIFDAIQTLLTRLQRQPEPSDNDSRTLMSKVAKHKAIALGSDLFEAGVAQFSRNMSALIGKYAEAGIPVVLATLASNIKDQPPFSSDNGQKNNAEALYSAAVDAFNKGQFDLAKTGFIEAKQKDMLRFRAPEQFNNVIKNLGKRPNVYLADVVAAMEARSQQGIIGQNLMLEHLHPNLPGYFILANTLYEAIADAGLASPFERIPANLAWQQRPITPAEEYAGFAQIQALTSDYPFTPSPVPITLPTPADWQQRLGRAYYAGRMEWLTMMKRLRQGYKKRGNQPMYIKTTRLLADALPHDPQFNTWAAELLAAAGRPTEADYYYQRAKRAGLVSVTAHKANKP